ncbi:MAG: xanthine phosphoribosyltransferase [Clostridiales bacterium]|nr:xanthine phosphoribosyltransferase [Clostridiales bacterium]MCF8021914.1 xanthine phosphoribosyltransferase [Clostridiales bacterium]
MDALKEKILNEGKVLSDKILKVDSFLNHQIEPSFALQLGQEIVYRFREENINKILTVEASGIAVAFTAGLELNVPVVFAKKNRASTSDFNVLKSSIYSFTKRESIDIYVNKNYLHKEDNILLIDDFLAHGEALKGLVNIIRQSQANLVGAGIVIEKVFQQGGRALRDEGVRIESLAPVASLAGGKVIFCT